MNIVHIFESPKNSFLIINQLITREMAYEFDNLYVFNHFFPDDIYLNI